MNLPRPLAIIDGIDGSDGSDGLGGFNETPLDGDPLPGATWRPLDIATLAQQVKDGTVETPRPTIGTRTDGKALLYSGRVNGIAGESGGGKTFTATVMAYEELRAKRHVVYVDLEDTPHTLLDRLVKMGADVEMLATYFHYVQPEEKFDIFSRDQFLPMIEHLDPSLVVIDSAGEALALEGINGNDDTPVAEWFRRLPKKVADLGPAVLLLDHVPKSKDGGVDYAIGSQRKRAAITGIQLIQESGVEFSKDKDGFAKLRVTKDKLGNYSKKSIAAHLEVKNGGRSVRLVAPPETASSGAWRPTGIMERISKLLEQSHEPLGVNAIKTEIGGKATNVDRAIAALVTEGYILVKAQGQKRLHELIKPYREADETRESVDAFDESDNRFPNRFPIEGESGNRLERQFPESVGNRWESGNRLEAK